MTRITKMGRKTYEEATPYHLPSSTVAPQNPSTKRAALPSQSEMETSLGLNSRSEGRRKRRETARNDGKVCFNCRLPGHRISSCPSYTPSHPNPQSSQSLQSSIPQSSSSTSSAKATRDGPICYRCGSKSHSLNQCRSSSSKTKGLPFAQCFICKESGHITSSCPTNANGIYPKGGACMICGSKEHFAKDCERPGQVRSGGVVGEVVRLDHRDHGGLRGPDEGGADEDEFHVVSRVEREINKIRKPPPKTVKKVITF